MSQNRTYTGKRFDFDEPDTESSVDAHETNSLCCGAAGITAPISATAEALRQSQLRSKPNSV
mgnify:CR=1 FL=1